ncbi:hypothetical protein SORBI_3004G325832 [Sorghum bicolor]|uniref:Uncharacterized protein n=1 Tax=Sorghum bicolor TaxID=4558 RepID=A0A1Z5RQY7_SORBI|nr:hypothetical protein SORBI_3004G325832 [Sorghum bicolor]
MATVKWPGERSCQRRHRSEASIRLAAVSAEPQTGGLRPRSYQHLTIQNSRSRQSIAFDDDPRGGSHTVCVSHQDSPSLLCLDHTHTRKSTPATASTYTVQPRRRPCGCMPSCRETAGPPPCVSAAVAMP